MDTIAIRGIRAHGRHGARPGERDHAQAFDIDLELTADLTRARSSDALADTLDYQRLHARVVAIVGSTSFALLERLGEAILRDLLGDARVVNATITLAKPNLLAGATPSVTLRATNA